MTDPLYKKPRRWPKRLLYSSIIFLGLVYIINATSDPIDPSEDFQRIVERANERREASDKFYKERDERRKVERAAKSEQEERERLGHHCLNSLIDGRHNGFVRLVKDKMNDPSSFQHIDTKVSAVLGDGYHAIDMRFRGKNAFGGVVQNRAKGTYRHAGCRATLLSIS